MSEFTFDKTTRKFSSEMISIPKPNTEQDIQVEIFWSINIFI